MITIVFYGITKSDQPIDLTFRISSPERDDDDDFTTEVEYASDPARKIYGTDPLLSLDLAGVFIRANLQNFMHHGGKIYTSPERTDESRITTDYLEFFNRLHLATDHLQNELPPDL